MQIVIHPNDPLPIYRQIMRQIMDAIAGGRLKSGEQLGSHRELSEQLVIAPLTVKKAYDELEAMGYIETRRGRGTFISARFPTVTRTAQVQQISASARQLLTQAYLAGLTYADVVKALKDADRDIAHGTTHRKRGIGA